MATDNLFTITKLEPRVAPTSGIFGASDALNGDNSVEHVLSDSLNVSDALNENGHVHDVLNGNYLGNGNEVSANNNALVNVSFSDSGN